MMLRRVSKQLKPSQGVSSKHMKTNGSKKGAPASPLLLGGGPIKSQATGKVALPARKPAISNRLRYQCGGALQKACCKLQATKKRENTKQNPFFALPP